MATADAPTPDQVLALPLHPGGNAAMTSGATTVRGYLVALLRKLWAEEDDFSGKRPFGDSGWQIDLVAELVRAGVVAGTFDEDGYLNDDVDDPGANALILAAIDRLGAP